MKNYMKIIIAVIGVVVIGAALYFSNTKLQTGRLGRIPSNVNEARSDAGQAANDLGQAAGQAANDVIEFVDGVIADSCDLNLNPGPGQVILFEHSKNQNNGGKCITLAASTGATKDLIVDKFNFNDMASSIKVGPNTKVKLWEHNIHPGQSWGASYTVTGSIDNFGNPNLKFENSNLDLNDKVSTVEFLELEPCSCNNPSVVACGAPVGPSEIIGCRPNSACLSTKGTKCLFGTCSSQSQTCVLPPPNDGINIFSGPNFQPLPPVVVPGSDRNISNLNQRLTFLPFSINKGNDVLSYTLFSKPNMDNTDGLAISYRDNMQNILTAWGSTPVKSLSLCLAANNCGSASACTHDNDTDGVYDYADKTPNGDFSEKNSCDFSCKQCYKKNNVGNRCVRDYTQECVQARPARGGVSCTPSDNNDCKL